MGLNKYFQGLVFAAGFTAFATTASAHHGEEYFVSACDKEGKMTANMVVTTVGHRIAQDDVHKILQSTFSKLMERHDASAHSNITREYISDLVSSFSGATTAIIGAVNLDSVYLDFHHPHVKDGGPVTPGCK